MQVERREQPGELRLASARQHGQGAAVERLEYREERIREHGVWHSRFDRICPADRRRPAARGRFFHDRLGQPRLPDSSLSREENRR